MKEILFLKPVLQERIWGGTELKNKFGYDIPSNKTGECWSISAHDNGLSIIKNGKFAGKSLKELWEKNRELFGNVEGDKFPLLIKILDANKVLSVQVHPDDEYARENENGELGKTECWYIIDCKKNAEIVLGHNAKSKQELSKMIKEGRWDNLLRRVKIKPGDFFYVPSGTIHALCDGTIVLETQQSSDTTYRVYDYDRLNDDGNKRELNIDKSIDVTTVPHNEEIYKLTVETLDNAEITTYLKNEFFSIYKWNVIGKQVFTNDKPFLLVSVLEGKGNIFGETIKKGDNFIIPYGYNELVIEGNVELMVSHI